MKKLQPTPRAFALLRYLQFLFAVAVPVPIIEPIHWHSLY
jgi:hypothetical protein